MFARGICISKHLLNNEAACLDRLCSNHSFNLQSKRTDLWQSTAQIHLQLNQCELFEMAGSVDPKQSKKIDREIKLQFGSECYAYVRLSKSNQSTVSVGRCVRGPGGGRVLTRSSVCLSFVDWKEFLSLEPSIKFAESYLRTINPVEYTTGRMEPAASPDKNGDVGGETTITEQEKLMKTCIMYIICDRLRQAAVKNCNGCEIGHPSQRQHMYIGGCMSDWDDQVGYYFDKVFSELDGKVVIDTYSKAAGLLNLATENAIYDEENFFMNWYYELKEMTLVPTDEEGPYQRVIRQVLDNNSSD